MPRRLSRLAAMRNAVGKTQQELADVLNVHLRNVQRWELGRSVPESRRWPDYARALNVPVADLMDAIIEISQLSVAK